MGVDAMSVEDLKKLNKNKKLVKKLGEPYCVACSRIRRHQCSECPFVVTLCWQSNKWCMTPNAVSWCLNSSSNTGSCQAQATACWCLLSGCSRTLLDIHRTQHSASC